MARPVAEETIPTELSDFAPNPVIALGAGSPVVFLHGPFGQEWVGFLDDLAEDHRVYAPANPGAADPEDLRKLDGFHDLILYYDELFDRLGLDVVALVGHSFGGMVAAEYAAAYPRRVSKLVLIDAMGLWRDEYPVQEWLNVAPARMTQWAWHDVSHPELVARAAIPEDPTQAQAQFIRQFAGMASTSHFIFPIPERGLEKRLRRIAAQTLLLWGSSDQLVPPAYAHDFAKHIADSTIVTVDQAGHYPHLEQRDVTSSHVRRFLRGDHSPVRPNGPA